MAEKKDVSEITSFTKYERARMLGSRALQIAMGAPFLIKLSEEDLEKLEAGYLAFCRKIVYRVRLTNEK